MRGGCEVEARWWPRQDPQVDQGDAIALPVGLYDCYETPVLPRAFRAGNAHASRMAGVVRWPAGPRAGETAAIANNKEEDQVETCRLLP